MRYFFVFWKKFFYKFFRPLEVPKKNPKIGSVGHRVEQKNVETQKPISYNIFIYKMDIWICPRFFQFRPPSGQKWRFSVKKWRFGGGVKNVKNQFFFLVHLFIFKRSRKQCTLLFFVSGPLVVKYGVFRYRPPIFGRHKNVVNQNFISYNIFEYIMDIWIHNNFFWFFPLVAKNGVFGQKWHFGERGVKNVKNEFLKVRESNVSSFFSFLAPKWPNTVFLVTNPHFWQ